MLSLVLCAALSQTPQKVAIAYSSNLGVSAKRAADISAALLDLLIAEGLNPVQSRVPCEDRSCVVYAAKELDASAVISIAFAALGKDTVVDLECMWPDGTQLAQKNFTVGAGDVKLPADVRAFAAAVKQGIAAGPPKAAVAEPPPPVVENDKPKEQKLIPKDEDPPPELIVERPERSRVPGAVVGAGAIAVGVTAVILMALAAADANEANRTVGPGMAAHPRAEAEQLRDSANLKYSASLSAGIAAGALAVTSIVLFAY